MVLIQRTLIIACTLIILLASFRSATANTTLPLYLFWGEGCPHCANEKVFLETVKTEYPNVVVHDFELYYHPENVELVQYVAQKLGIQVNSVPLLIIGDKPISGFSETITPDEITNRITYCTEHVCPDSIAPLITSPAEAEENAPPVSEETNDKNTPDTPVGIDLPIFGSIDPSTFSLPVLTVILGALDGFNPCAMWTLLFLISMLIGMNDKKRMWLLGSAFILASAFVYFLFMAAWLNLVLFLGFIIWVRIAIGLVAIGGGAYNLREFFTNKANTCKVTASDKQQKTFDKIKAVVQKDSFYLALGGIILLAFAVNLVELICSAGLPAVYTQVLALSNLSTWQYYAYILFYVFIFMLDDLIVFFIAMFTLQVTGITAKYTRASHLIGGVLMLVIGVLLIIAPQVLMFG